MTEHRASEPIFAAWKGRPLDAALGACVRLVEDADFPTVRRWRERGGKVAGHFQVYFPSEIVHAAGMLPFKVRGASIEPEHADSRFGSYLCSIVKTSLELALSGRVELDLFVSHPICDAARNLAAVWGRNVRYPCRILYLPQNPNSAASAEYLASEYRRLLDVVQDVSGRKVTDRDLARSIAEFNANRALLRELQVVRREEPWKIASHEAYALVSLAGLVPVEEANEILEHLLPRIRERPAKPEDRVRVVFEGGFCEQPPIDLVQAIGRSCYVVDDDLMVGLRYLLEDVPGSGDPCENLARAYLGASGYSPVQHDRTKPKERMLLEKVRAARADAVILSAAKMCEPGLEEQVAYAGALDELGIPYFVGEFEENMTSLDSFEIQLETFVEGLLFE